MPGSFKATHNPARYVATSYELHAHYFILKEFIHHVCTRFVAWKPGHYHSLIRYIIYSAMSYHGFSKYFTHLFLTESQATHEWVILLAKDRGRVYLSSWRGNKAVWVMGGIEFCGVMKPVTINRESAFYLYTSLSVLIDRGRFGGSAYLLYLIYYTMLLFLIKSLPFGLRIKLSVPLR